MKGSLDWVSMLRERSEMNVDDALAPRQKSRLKNALGKLQAYTAFPSYSNDFLKTIHYITPYHRYIDAQQYFIFIL